MWETANSPYGVSLVIYNMCFFGSNKYKMDKIKKTVISKWFSKWKPAFKKRLNQNIQLPWDTGKCDSRFHDTIMKLRSIKPRTANWGV